MFESDAQRSASRWEVIRLKSGSQTQCTNLSPAFFPVTTHWFDRTVLCCIDDCDLCELLPSRGLFYLAVWCMQRTRLLELGAQASGHLEQHAKLLHGGLKPGQVVNCSRRGLRQPVYSEIVDFHVGTTPMDTLHLANKVMALYKMPCINPSENLEGYAMRIAGMVRKRNQRLALEWKAGKIQGPKGR